MAAKGGPAPGAGGFRRGRFRGGKRRGNMHLVYMMVDITCVQSISKLIHDKYEMKRQRKLKQSISKLINSNKTTTQTINFEINS